jgi:uncharacterized protein (TIGR03118 family)
MKRQTPGFGRVHKWRVTALGVGGVALLAAAGLGAQAATASTSGTVLQTNLVSDLPGVAQVQDPNLVNPWGISASSGSPFWVSDNNAGVTTLYSGHGTGPVSIVGLVVSIPTPVDSTGASGTPTGTVFNPNSSKGAFPVSGVNAQNQPASAPALFLFSTEDGTITGWNPGVNPLGFNPAKAGTYSIIAADNSGNNFTNPDPTKQTGAVYKGLAIATSSTPIVAADADSTALLYASNFRAGTVDVYDSKFKKVTVLPAGAFKDPELPHGYAPFNVQALGARIYVTYALQNATRHDDLSGNHRGFVDVFNLDGTPGGPKGARRLISRGQLDSPWGLAIAPAGFAGISAPSSDQVLLVGNFGNGQINAYDASTGSFLGGLRDPDGEAVSIDGLWALRVGNGGNGGATNTVYFTAGLLGERHGLFGSLTTATPGSPEGPAEAQWAQANLDVVQLDQNQLATDAAGGAPAAAIKQDIQTLEADTDGLARAERTFAEDAADDAGVKAAET